MNIAGRSLACSKLPLPRSKTCEKASSGIGRATALALAAAGARVVLAARRAGRLEELAEEIGQSGGEAIALPADGADYGQAEAMVRLAEEAFGGVEVLVNVAGIMLPAPIAEADPADWRRMVDALLQEDLLDELRLMVHPVVVGSGKRLFEDGGDRKALELVDSKTFGTGVLYLTYRPAHD